MGIKSFQEPRTTNHGFTLVEVLVSLVIISITATGIFASFIAAQSYVKRSKRRIIAFNFARQQFEQLKPAVRQDTWDTGSLTVTDADNDDCADDPGDWTPWSNLPGDFGTTWGGQSRRCISNAPMGRDYREVQLQIKWNEP